MQQKLHETELLCCIDVVQKHFGIVEKGAKETNWWIYNTFNSVVK